MAFPDNQLSTRPLPHQLAGGKVRYLPPRTVSLEDGPVAEQDPSEGMRYQEWMAQITPEGVFLEAENTPARLLLPNPSGTITDIAIAFNQNADLHYVWVDDGVARFRYYDTVTSQMETMTLPEGVRTPKLTMDDKRNTQTANNDIVLTYRRGNSVYFRLQRDRFLIERDPTEPLPEPERSQQRANIALAGGIVKFGMNRQWRLQWQLDTDPNGPY